MLGAMLLVGFAIRVPQIQTVTGAPDLEASYHVLLTSTALQESRMSDSLLLPLVTLGRSSDKAIPWGATVPTAQGNYIYTSFPPFGFLAPALFFTSFHLPPSLPWLVSFNFILQSIACAGLYALLLRLVDYASLTPGTARFAALAGVSVQVFASEALLSYGLVYWGQQVFQIILLLMLSLLLSLLEEAPRRHLRLLALGVLAFLGAWTEWTGYVFGAGVITILFLRDRRSRTHREIAAVILCALLAAIVITVAHLAMATGLKAALHALAARFLQRSATKGSPADLAAGYVVSYGLLLLAIPLAAVCLRGAGVRWTGLGAKPMTIFAMASCAVLENVLLMQHATEFSFDRLKLAIPLAMLVALVAARFGPRWRAAVAAGLLLAFLQNWHSYAARLASRAEWTATDRGNRSIAAQLEQQVDMDCVLLGTTAEIRGYAVLLFHRNIHEHVTEAELLSLPAQRACARVYLKGEDLFTDLPRFTEATIEGTPPTVIRPR